MSIATRAIEDRETTELEQAAVFRKSLGCYIVRTNGREIACSISNKLRKRLLYPTADPGSRRARVVDVEKIHTVDPVAIGDEVAFFDSGDGTGVARPRLLNGDGPSVPTLLRQPPSRIRLQGKERDR